MPSPPAASVNVSDHLKPDAIALLDRVKALAARMQHPAAGPLHLLAELLEDDATRMAAKRNGGAPEAALARCRDELGKLPTGTVTSAMLPSLARITREAGCYGGGLSGLTLAAKNGAPANVRALFRLALDPPTDGATETVATREPRRGEDRTEGAPEARERQAGPLPVSAGMRATLESIYAAQETPPPANDLPLWTVQYVERELGTTLPDDFWVAIAHANKVLAEQGVGQTMPHGDPAMPDEVAEVVLGVATEASVHVPAGYVAFVSRDPTQPRTTFCVCAPA